VQKAYTSEIKQLGKRIKKIRISKKMTQQALADKCELDIRTIQRIEAGQHAIKLNTLYALAEALDCTVADLAL
jgi:transcriptional regulator with XRE-family HTH domain